jgi:hypothetical protein
MGKIAWWEVFLKKYEEDENVKITDTMRGSFSRDIQEALDFSNIETIPDRPEEIIEEDILTDIELEMNEFSDNNQNDNDVYIIVPERKAHDLFPIEPEQEPINIEEDEKDNETESKSIEEVEEFPILDDRQTYLNDTLKTQEKLDLKTIEEKKAPTQNFTNKLMDTNFSVSLKETEKLREFYDNRLKIVSVNPDKNAYPITMYDCNTIEKHVIGMKYNLEDFTEKNRFRTRISTGYVLAFNFVFTEKFTSEIIDLSTSEDTSILTVKMERHKLVIQNQIFPQEDIKIDHKLDINEFYKIIIGYSKNPNQFFINIFKLVNKEQELVYQNIYAISIDTHNISLNRLNLYGGKFYINEITLKVNNNQILIDYCNPILQMNQFGG